MRVLCPEPESFSVKGLNYLKSFSNLVEKKLTQSEFEKIAHEFDAVLIRFNTKVDYKILNPSSNIKAIISPTTGLDHIDMDLATRSNVKVFHLKGQTNFLKTVSATAELTIALMLSIFRKIPDSFYSVKKGEWNSESFKGNEIYGKTLGIIGYGRLGYKVAKIAKSMGMKVIFYDPFVSYSPKWIEKKDNMSNLFAESDVISLHIPLTGKTKHLIADNEINKMKFGVVIINTSRGSIIKTSSLLQGLKTGRVSSAALDVIEDEHLNLGINHPLVRHSIENDNLIITPHIGGTTFESVEKTDLFILKKYYKEMNESKL